MQETEILNPELTKEEKKAIVKFLSRKGNINKCAEKAGLNRNTVRAIKGGAPVEDRTILKIKHFIKTYLAA